MPRSSSALLISALVLPLIIQVTLAAESTIAEDVYIIQPGDILEVSVWKEEDLLREVLVRPDGGMSFPLVGNVQAAGNSVEALQAEITERLTKYIPDPVVTVSTRQLNGNKVYVIGKVTRPGEFVANRYMDIVQALSMAGGMTPYAAANKIKVLRRENGKLTAIPFRYGDIEKGEDLEQNIILQSGDVVLVP
ncbi:polysaccharide biosynthesis/export family protein [Crocinitomicaceae bacterium]|nr:polysaccharide biosynthesis/export family protein [Crocinitomicaceae bacterium]